MPAGDGITFTYGDYSFDPRPLFTVNKEIIKTAGNSGLATKYSMTLNGNILPTGTSIDDTKGGLNTVFSGVEDLRQAFARDFNLLTLNCETSPSSAPIVSGYPKVISVDITNASDNYTRRADYTINLELPSITGGATREAVGMADGGGDFSSYGLVSLSDEVSIEFLDERVGETALDIFGDTLPSVFSINRSISAQGDSLAPTGDYVEPWQLAKSYIESTLGETGNFNSYFTGVMCVNDLNITNTFRTLSVNKTDGTCSATQTHIAFTGTDQALEEFDASIDQSHDTPLTTVTVNGTIQGFVGIDYTDKCPPEGSKFNNAYAKWSDVSGVVFSRATNAFRSVERTGVRAGDTLHPRPLSTAIGYNPIVGTITYSYSYDNRLDFIDGNAIAETINYTFTDPADLYASLTILGRSSGPLLQKLGTKGPTTREISIDAVFVPTTTAGTTLPTTTAYDTIMDNPFGSVDKEELITTDSKTWEPRMGHFTWTRAWEIGSC